MIRFPCPNCAAGLKVSDDCAGQTIRCPRCQRVIPVPESPGDEPSAAEHDATRQRRVPLWAWGAVAFVLLVIVVGVGAFVATRSGPKDGLTRAERAQLEANLRSSLPGVWEAVPVKTDGYSYYTGFYHFTEDGRFRAFQVVAGDPRTRYVGTWTLSGSTLTMKITEFVHAEAGDRVTEQLVLDVRSENGNVFRFTTAWADIGSKHLTFTKQQEPPPKAEPAPKQPVPPPKKEDGLTGDQRLAKWLIGKWSSQGTDGMWEWEFFLPLETSGQYSVRVFNAGREVGSFHGQWFIAAGQLTLTVGVSFYEKMPSRSSHLFEIARPTNNEFVLNTASKEYVTKMARRK